MIEHRSYHWEQGLLDKEGGERERAAIVLAKSPPFRKTTVSVHSGIKLHWHQLRRQNGTCGSSVTYCYCSCYCYARRNQQLLRRFLSLVAIISLMLRPGTRLSDISSILTAVDADEIGQEVRDDGVGKTDCLTYENGTFSLSCDFNWHQHYNGDDYIMLKAGEIFYGNDHSINLDGISNLWEGLFKIATDAEWEQAPTIKHVHTLLGEITLTGGFIVQANQNNFIVDSCSSSGIISGRDGCHSNPCTAGGGICGHQCSGTILITKCWSTGHIQGQNTGGIAGRLLGFGGGHINITHCYSTGDIRGMNSGGICGSRAGFDGGHVLITSSYSTGEISGRGSGGICGVDSARTHGDVKISQCYALGQISGPESGGILGRRSSAVGGHVEITNTYVQGDITGSNNAGGICGRETGLQNGIVTIENVYSSGKIQGSEAGGIIGHSHSGAQAIKVTMSLCNGGPIVRLDPDSKTEEVHNSHNISDVLGTVYCYHHDILCWDTNTIWKAMPPDGLPVLQAHISPSLSPSASRRPKRFQREILPVQRGRRHVI